MNTNRRSFFPLLLTLVLGFKKSLFASDAGRDFNEADSELNAAYKKLQSRISDPRTRELLVQAQRAWIVDRDANVAFFYARFPASKGGLFFKTRMIRERTAFLEAVIASKDDDGYSAIDT